MILHIVCIRDSAAGAFNRPYFAPSTGLAVRAFRDEVNRSAADNPMFSHPTDFELYTLGTFDDADASFESHSPSLLSRAIDLKE